MQKSAPPLWEGLWLADSMDLTWKWILASKSRRARGSIRRLKMIKDCKSLMISKGIVYSRSSKTLFCKKGENRLSSRSTTSGRWRTHNFWTTSSTTKSRWPRKPFSRRESQQLPSSQFSTRIPRTSITSRKAKDRLTDTSRWETMLLCRERTLCNLPRRLLQ